MTHSLAEQKNSCGNLPRTRFDFSDCLFNTETKEVSFDGFIIGTGKLKGDKLEVTFKNRIF